MGAITRRPGEAPIRGPRAVPSCPHGGEVNRPAAVVTWARGNALWLTVAVVAVAVTLAGVLVSQSDGPGAPKVKGQQLTRPDAARSPTTASTSAPATTSTTASATTTSTATGTTPGAGSVRPGGTTGGPAAAPGSGAANGGTPGTTAPSIPPEIAPALTATRVLDWSPSLLGSQGADVWAVDSLESGRVARVDAGAARAVGQAQPYVSGLAPVADGAWVVRSACPSGAAQLVHVDRAAHATAVLSVAQPIVCDLGPGRNGLAATPGALWVVTKDPARAGFGLLLDIDPASGAVVDRVAFDGVPHDVQTDGGAVWVTLSGVPSVSADDLVLAAMDPSTRRELGRAVVRAPFGFPIVHSGNIWAGGANGLRSIPRTGGAERVYLPVGAGCGGGQLFGFVPGAVTSNTIWGTRLDLAGTVPTGPVTHQSVCRIDVASGKTTGWSPGALQVVGGDDGGAWLTDPALGGLVRWTVG